MLTVNRFHAAYHVPQGAPDPDGLQRRLNRLVQERLPESIEGELAHSPADPGAIYVIRRLHLSLWLDALAMEDGEAADRWGRLVAGAVARAILYGDGDNVRRFEDAAGFLAAFLGDLIAGTAWTQWPYEEFRPLEGLTAGQVASHVLAPRAALIVRVAERLAETGRLEDLLASLAEPDVALVWDRGLGFDGLDTKRLPPDVAALLGDTEVPASFLRGGGSFGRSRLAAYLHLSLRSKRYEPSEAIAVVAHGLARLQQLMDARPAPWVWRALAAGEVDSPSALGEFLTSLGGSTAPARDWLAGQLSAPGGPAGVARLARALLPEDTTAAPAAGGDANQANGSAFAGLALLLPAVRELGLYEQGGREAVYQVLLDALGPDSALAAARDAGPQLLAGIEPRDAGRARTAAVAWPAVATDPAAANDLSPADAGYQPVTLEVLRRFAGRLRGFEASSPEYLGRQFLRLPGHIELDETSVTVTLHQAPLGLVLQMNGLSGGQGPFAWLGGRELTINLPQATP